jgi:hypothetical protein
MAIFLGIINYKKPQSGQMAVQVPQLMQASTLQQTGYPFAVCQTNFP